MTKVNCEAVRIASTAASDGYAGTLEPAQLADHLAQCADCRREVEGLRELMGLLTSQTRRASTEQLWNGIDSRLNAAQEPILKGTRDLRLLAPMGVVLLAYKLFEQLSARNTGVIKLVPLLLVLALFALLKENPFKINAELRVKGD